VRHGIAVPVVDKGNPRYHQPAEDVIFRAHANALDSPLLIMQPPSGLRRVGVRIERKEDVDPALDARSALGGSTLIDANRSGYEAADTLLRRV